MSTDIKETSISQEDYLASACCSDYDHCYDDDVKDECKRCNLYYLNKNTN